MASTNNWHNASAPRSFGAAKGDSRPFETSSNDITNFHSVGQGDGRHSNETRARIKHLTTFFGEPNPMRKYEFDNAPYESENQDYPEAFTKLWGSNGKSGAAGFQSNEYIRKVLIEKTKASENWQLTVMAPWTEHKGGGLSFSWEEIRFNRHMLDREPEESVPRLMTQTATSGSASMVRYGISLLLEANFAATPIGQQTYLMNLEQIRVATVETCSYGVMVSIMEHTPYHNSYNIAHQQAEQRDKQKLDELFKEECSSFGMAHKETDSYELIKSKLKGILASRCNTDEGNFTVLPEGMGKFVQRSRDVKYYLDGRSRASNISGLDRPADQTIVDSRAFSQGEWTPGHDPCFRHQTIGGFSTLDDASLLNMEVEKYRTWMLNFMGYDEDSDDFYEFRYKDIYQKVGWWNFKQPNAPITEKLGKQYAYDFQCYTWGQLARRNASDYDKFIHKLSLLTAEQQQQCLSTLRLLPKGHELADPRSAGENFSRRSFDSMVEGDIKWDTQFTVGQRKSLKRKAERGDTIGEKGEDLQKYDDYLQRTGQSDSLDEEGLSDMQQWEEGEEIEVSPSTPVDDYHMSYSLDHQQPVVSRTRAAQTTTRLVPRKKSPLNAAAVKAAPSLTERTLMEREIADLFVFLHSKMTITDVLAMDKNFKDRLASPAQLVASFLQTAVNMPDASDETKRMLVANLSSIVRKEISEVTKKPNPSAEEVGVVLVPALVPVLQSKIVASFVPVLGRAQMPLVFQGVYVDQTPLERAMKGSAADLGDIKDESVAKAGWWNPKGTSDPKEQEDGQVTLMVDPSPSVHGLPLPHDSYAATMAANHHVLFAVDAAADIFDADDLTIEGGLKKSRKDALVYSIILSLVASGRLVADGSQGQGQASSSVSIDGSPWLDRVAKVKGLPMAILPSQAHLSKLIQDSNKTIAGWFTTKTTNFKLLDAKLAPSFVLTPDLDALKTAIHSRHAEPAKAIKPPTSAALFNELTPIVLVSGTLDYNPGTSTMSVDASVLLQTAVELAEKIFLAAPSHSWNELLQKYADSLVDDDSRKDLKRLRPVLTKYYQTKLGVGKLETTAAATSWTRSVIRDLLDRASLVSGSFFRFCVDFDIPLPLAMRLWRPSKTYNMGSVIRMTAGANGAAKTFVSDMKGRA